MKNLAGDQEADKYIQEELELARVPILMVPRDDRHREVPYTLVGSLGGFLFERSWYYWVVKGRMPLPRAQKLYADPIGKTTVRVAGHCGCPEPADPWIDYVACDKSGKEKPILHGEKNLEELAKSREAKLRGESSWLASWCDTVDEKYIVSPDPLIVPGVSAFIQSYHVDSQEGLNRLTDEIYDLVGLTK